jgi:thiol-disulfide isomerase/thioredoxin
MSNNISLYLPLLAVVFLAPPALSSFKDQGTASIRLTEEEKRLIVAIVASNRANRESFSSFDCLFERKSTRPNSSMTYSGRYVFKGDSIYHRQVNLNRGEGVTMIEANGKHYWFSDSKPPIAIGCETINVSCHGKAVANDPWQKMENIGSILMELSSESDRISSAKEKTIEGLPCIIVEIDKRLRTDPPDKYPYKQFCHFSVTQNYLPVRIEMNSVDEAGKLTRNYIKTITKINSYDVNDQTVYVPVEYHDEFHRGGQKYREGSYRVLEETVKFNPKLPDDLFQITLDPCALFWDKDRDLRWTVPAEGVIGSQAPDFTLDRLEGGKVTLLEIKEDVIVLVFWATWCGPCKIVMPVLNSLHQWVKENNKSVAFNCISDEQADIVAAFKKKQGYDIPVLLDVTQRPVYKTYKGIGIPYVVVISKGIIQSVFIGSGGEPPVLEQHFKSMIIVALEASNSTGIIGNRTRQCMIRPCRAAHDLIVPMIVASLTGIVLVLAVGFKLFYTRKAR